MSRPYELVMYSRTTPCAYVTIARGVLTKRGVPYRELFIDEQDTYRQRVLDWTGFLSVPTLIVVEPGGELPVEPPTLLPKGASPRGVNRGSMITEATEPELVAWLTQHGLLP
ncbi:MAG TPA: glutaredoxin family protein [Aggregatilineales bacterium]|nr:glutaredoxin family protein [Anaerolineales bacterium]HRE47286.1 glutaredoxin family protein [Aggregatilineales bacterium]